MVLSGFQPLVNAVLSRWELRTRLEFRYQQSDYLRILFTDEPYRDPRIELYLLPVEMCLNRISEEGWNLVPVLAYGPAVLLEKGFLAGCSDYLREPWGVDEFEIRALRLLRLRQLVFPWGRIQFDQFRLWSGDRSCDLSTQEYWILKTLVFYKGEMVKRDYFYGMYSRQFRPKGKILETYVSSLRKKIDYCLPEQWKGYEVIMTIRRVGYLLRC